MPLTSSAARLHVFAFIVLLLLDAAHVCMGVWPSVSNLPVATFPKERDLSLSSHRLPIDSLIKVGYWGGGAPPQHVLSRGHITPLQTYIWGGRESLFKPHTQAVQPGEGRSVQMFRLPRLLSRDQGAWQSSCLSREAHSLSPVLAVPSSYPNTSKAAGHRVVLGRPLRWDSTGWKQSLPLPTCRAGVARAMNSWL